MKRIICICGSFKFHSEMEEAAHALRGSGYEVFVPKPSHIRHKLKPELLKTKYSSRVLRKWEGVGAFEHLGNIKASDIVYIFNKHSYIGPAVSVEIGYALALGKPIFARSRVKDITISNFITKVTAPDMLEKEINKLVSLKKK